MFFSHPPFFVSVAIAALLLADDAARLDALVVGLRVHQFGENLARVAGRIGVVGVLAGLLLRALLAAVPAKDVLVMVEVVVLVLVGVLGGHDGFVWCWTEAHNGKKTKLLAAEC